MRGDESGEDVTFEDLSLAWAAGGVVSTAEDVDRFWTSLLRGELVSKKRLRQMLSETSDLTYFDYGLGVMLVDTKCGRMVGHSGRIFGFSAESWTLVDQGRSATIIENDGDSDRARDIADTALCP